jgi:predicted phosphohydrolase
MGRIRKQQHGPPPKGDLRQSVMGARQWASSDRHHQYMVEQDAARMERRAKRIAAKRAATSAKA